MFPRCMRIPAVLVLVCAAGCFTQSTQPSSSHRTITDDLASCSDPECFQRMAYDLIEELTLLKEDKLKDIAIVAELQDIQKEYLDFVTDLESELTNLTDVQYITSNIQIGATGATGSTGIYGATGSTGQRGGRGADGASGIQGAHGVIGPMGGTGVIGDIGEIGATGDIGLPGRTGASGSTGAQGNTGATGRPGYIL